jgi:DNA invertase Pin-like site-specific DNA recombinase
MEGLKAALARGRKGGRPRKLSDRDLTAARAMLDAGTITVAEVAQRIGVSRQTLYEYLPQARTRSRQPTT